MYLCSVQLQPYGELDTKARCVHASTHELWILTVEHKSSAEGRTNLLFRASTGYSVNPV